MEPVFVVNEFQLDCERLELSRNGRVLKVERKPLDLLILLVKRHGDLVTRSEIAERLWDPTVFVDTEHGINTAVRKIRRTLRDDPDEPRFVQTVPGKGYRFIATAVDVSPVPQVSTEAIPDGIDFAPPPDVEVFRQEVASTTRLVLGQRRGRNVPAWLVFGSVAAALLIALGATAFRLGRSTEFYTVAGFTQITSYPGSARHPSYSPDARQVAFSWDGEGARSIYVAVPQSEQRLRLTHSPFADDFPVWSPDGKYIAFLRLTNPYAGQLMLVPALGGPEPERTLHPVNLSFETASSSSFLAWTPDSKRICFTTRSDDLNGRERLMLISPDTGELRSVFPKTDRNESDSSPAFSPDGRWLAFARFTHSFNSTIFVQRLSPALHPDGGPIAVRETGLNPQSPVWTPDGQSLLFLERLSSRLFQAGMSDILAMQPARQIYVANMRLEGLSFASPEPRLCTSMFASGSELWAMPLKGDAAGARVPRKILQSKVDQYHPEYSPDGRWLAFVSIRDGSSQVWISPASGVNPSQLTRQPNYILGFPRWSPDGRSIAFHARVLKDAELYVIGVQDGVLRQVTGGLPTISAPSWSTDGKFLYGFGKHDGSEFVSRVTIAGGKRELLWEGVIPREAPGRHLLLYARINRHGIFARPLTARGAAEPEQKLVDDFIAADIGGFVPFTDGFYYTSRDAAGNPRAFSFYSFESKKTIDLAPAPQDLSNGFAVSPDRTTVVYATFKSKEADLISLELKKEGR